MTDETVSSLLTQAYHYRANARPKKADVLSEIEDMARSGRLDMSTLAYVYAYFLDMGTKARTIQQWTSLPAKRAIREKDVREALYQRYRPENLPYILSTDGHRIHAVWADDLEPGFYALDRDERLDIDKKYPDVKRVVDEALGAKREIYSTEEALGWAVERPGEKYESRRIPGTKFGIKAKYLNEAIWKSPAWVGTTDNGSAALIGPSQKLDSLDELPWFAIVMPLRLDTKS